MNNKKEQLSQNIQEVLVYKSASNGLQKIDIYKHEKTSEQRTWSPKRVHLIRALHLQTATLLGHLSYTIYSRQWNNTLGPEVGGRGREKIGRKEHQHELV